MENDDLLSGESTEELVDATAAVPETPAEPNDVSPDLNTDGVKSVADAIDFGLSEVDARREGKKPTPAETDEEKTAREALEAETAANAGKTPEEIAAAKAEADKAKDPASKIKSAVEDPIPATVAEKTRDRMQTLIGVVKDQTSQIAQHQAFVDQIAATGATPVEFNTMMSYMSAVHSDDPAKLKLAQDLLVSELEQISLKLGTAAPGIDFLSKYPDLQAQVERGEIRREAAQELAITRTRVASDKTQKDQTAARERQQNEVKQTRDNAQTELTALGDELYKRDGQEYLRRYAILEPALEALGMLDPKQWKAAFLAAYNKIPAPVKAPTLPKPGAPTVAAVPAKGQPLRTNKTPSGESNSGPKSLFEAIDAAITNGN